VDDLQGTGAYSFSLVGCDNFNKALMVLEFQFTLVIQILAGLIHVIVAVKAFTHLKYPLRGLAVMGNDETVELVFAYFIIDMTLFFGGNANLSGF